MEYLIELQFKNYAWVIILPLILMVLDIITGYYNAWKTDNIKSAKMRDGIGKKIAELCYIVVGMLFGIVFSIKAVAYFISFYIIYMEIVSIAENCEKLGIKMPTKISQKLNNKDGDKK